MDTSFSSIKEPKKESNNRLLNPSVSKMIKTLYLNDATADVFFVFGDQQHRERIPAHKNLLAAGSDVFKVMFYGPLKEKGDVKIVDASAASFKEFLQFFYLDELKLTSNNLFEVINLGKKYVVSDYLKICEKFLKITLTVDNVCLSYGLSIIFDLNELRKLCEAMIAGNTEAVFESSSFCVCPRWVLGQILTSLNLSCGETHVFYACMAWLKAESKEDIVSKDIVRVYLNNLFYEIRFGWMTIEEFAGLLHTHGDLFTSQEYREIVQMIVVKEFQPKMFKQHPRRVEWLKNKVIECNRTMDHLNTSTFYLQNVETTIFSTSQPIMLGEIVFADIYSFHRELQSEITLTEKSDNGSSEILLRKKIQFASLDQIIHFPQPMTIRPGFMYEIQLKQSPEDHEFEGAPLKMEVEIGPDTVIKFHGDRSYRSLITMLRFNAI